MPGFLQEFVTPIVKCTHKRTKQVKSFFSLNEFEEWKAAEPQYQSDWSGKFYKGLGTSTSVEAKGYFSDLNRHLIKYKYEDSSDEEAIKLAFEKSKAEARKDWLGNLQPGTYLDKNCSEIRYNDFVNRELILFSHASNVRAIPSVIDGMKPSQRKVLKVCFTHNIRKEMKVAQLGPKVADETAYHHGEQSLNDTIINMAQSHVGSNNINLLHPGGQFGELCFLCTSIQYQFCLDKAKIRQDIQRTSSKVFY